MSQHRVFKAFLRAKFAIENLGDKVVRVFDPNGSKQNGVYVSKSNLRTINSSPTPTSRNSNLSVSPVLRVSSDTSSLSSNLSDSSVQRVSSDVLSPNSQTLQSPNSTEVKTYSHDLLELTEVLHTLIHQICRNITDDREYVHCDDYAQLNKTLNSLQNVIVLFNHDLHLIQTMDKAFVVNHAKMRFNEDERKDFAYVGRGKVNCSALSDISSVAFSQSRIVDGDAQSKILSFQTFAALRAVKAANAKFNPQLQALAKLTEFYIEVANRLQKLWEIEKDQYVLKDVLHVDVSKQIELPKIKDRKDFMVDLPVFKYTDSMTKEMVTADKLELPFEPSATYFGQLEAWVEQIQNCLARVDNQMREHHRLLDQCMQESNNPTQLKRAGYSA